MTKVRLEAKPDYILRVAKVKDPLGGLAEIIWNALDAEATCVQAKLEVNDADGVEAVRVTDNGHGMPHPSCASYFGSLGGSWKATARVSADLGRSLHGQTGHGRLRGFSLGQSLRWTSVAGVTGGALERTLITSESGQPTDFDVSDPEVVPAHTTTGTLFEAWVPTSFVNRLTHPSARGRLTAMFAPFLATHPEVEIQLDGVALDPAAAWVDSALFRLSWPAQPEEEVTAVPLSEPIEATDDPLLRIIEWPQDVGRKLALCDKQGVELATTVAGIHKPGVHFTAYLLWDGLREHINVIALAEWEDTELAPLIDLARATIKAHLARRDVERRKEQVEKWKSGNVYPYDGSPTEATEVVERQVFDEVATTIARKLPKAIAQQKVTLRLLREVLSHDPEGLVPVLDELFRLPKAEQDELRRLLKRTTLSNIVKASAQVSDRLDFLRAIREMVFQPDVAEKVKERSELHKILERETWVFGERFTMMLSDKSLDAVLQRHLSALGREDEEVATPVRREDGRVGIVDLMLGAARRGSSGREHLVIELKAPSVKIGQKEVMQIKSYAEAVAADAQFRDARTTWDFMVISTEMDAVTRRDAMSQNLPPNCIASWDNDVRVWAYTWSNVVDECEGRLHYYREMLNHDPELEHATEYLLRVHGDRTPAALAVVK